MSDDKREPQDEEKTSETKKFEELLEAALKVDPSGLSGKHKSHGERKVKKPKPSGR